METKIKHQTGEAKKHQTIVEPELIPVDTFGGKVQVKWDGQATLTPLGQIAFFIEYLKTSGQFNKWVAGCPMYFASPNAPRKRDVLGTILLSVLAGHTRYSHINSAVNRN